MLCVLAEKPSVARDIAKILGANNKKNGFLEGNGYAVTWAFGHLVTLQAPAAYGFEKWVLEDLPMIPEQFKLQVNKEGSSQFKVVKELFGKADEIICATDAGREGELIFRYIYTLSGCRKPFKRLWISSLTDQAIKGGFDNLSQGNEYDNLYYSAKARSEADWLIGMNATRSLTLTSGSKKALSVGRVQTPVLGFIVNRHHQFVNFKPEKYYKVGAVLEGDIIAAHSGQFKVKQEAEELANLVNGKVATCKEKEVKEIKEKSPLPYDLTTLQRAANQKYGFSAQETLSYTQELYEKHKVVTYPRTDSCYLSNDMIGMVGEILPGLNIYQVKHNITISGNKVFNDKKVTDHHAIIPTGTKAEGLSDALGKVYSLIVDRFYATFLPECIKQTTKYEFDIVGHCFVAKGTVIKQQGWREVLKSSKKEKEQELPVLDKGDERKVVKAASEQKQTKPKPLHSESSLLKEMETAGKEIEEKELAKSIKGAGIGTPATRAGIIEILIKRVYVKREKKTLMPTELGITVFRKLEKLDIASPIMTAKWETNLKEVEAGEMPYNQFLSEVKKATNNLTAQLKEVGGQIQVKEDKISCPCCKKEMRDGPKGISCECGVVIWKEVSGKKLSESVIRDLITKGKTRPISGFISKKTGNEFKAPLVLNKGTKKVQFDFSKK
ncbi:type IA DNA topoisomerase [Xanthovirga aplysinae]|uniref:type IA DNA topoisomerase n=1 Tax=Xanthovirga aplysinae TaxID=2529853 RepID=UPI0012BD7671|nr:type IA DNA topoisomerase [Xanthovirga aplysinae]MTI33305.1 type IA DNA topoisomerase [Xanthovirga aplysinae]